MVVVCAPDHAAAIRGWRRYAEVIICVAAPLRRHVRVASLAFPRYLFVHWCIHVDVLLVCLSGVSAQTMLEGGRGMIGWLDTDIT